MPHLSDSDTQRWAQWREAAAQPSVDAELRRVFERLDAEIARRSPTCWLSGRCCRFESYGHKLYVTGLEIAWVIGQLDAAQRAALRDADLPALDGCSFQSDKLCGVHGVRPLGCRIYYCDPDAQDWQSAVYEGYLDDLRHLHEQRGIAYGYMEWRTGLNEAREAMRLS